MPGTPGNVQERFVAIPARNEGQSRIESRNCGQTFPGAAGKSIFAACWRELFLGFAALAERHDFGWIDGLAVDLHLDDFPALVNQIVDAARGFVFGIV